MVRRVLELDDPAARDAAVVGAKAAGLARASAAGLPVLPGVVVPVEESDAVVRAAAEAMGDAGSDVRARMAAMQVQPDPQLIAELRDRLAGFSAPLIVRSSSPLEADGTWSGAFSSFHGISADDLATAVRGCWGSAFSVGVLVRARETGTPPDRLGLAVLVQPELHPDVGGTARLRGDGSVVITSTHGPLLPLMEGHVEGSVSRIAPDGSVTTAEGLDESIVIEVAGLLRQVNKVLDHHLIEWAAVEGRVHLLQSLRSVEMLRGAVDDGDLDPALGSPVSLRVARLVQRFPGQLGYDLVMPWAVCFASPLPAPAHSDLEPLAALAVAQAEASALTAQLWGRSPRAAAAEAERVLRQLRGPAAAEAVAVLEGLPQPSNEQAAVILGQLEAVGRALRSRGVVDKDADFWRLTPEGLQRALLEGRAEAAGRFGVDQWEPFVHRAVTATGTAYDGTGVVPGAGAGRAYVVGDRVERTSPQGRYVIVAGQPLPSLAPLLWSAAGLVTRAGATGAHLLEFAHSIGVPTVVGCDLPPMDSDTPTLIAVDGDRGSVSVVAYGDD